MFTAAAIAQILIALAFVSIPLVRHRYGADAQVAAEKELARQGVRPEVLRENGLRFDASGHETWAPVTFAALMVVAAGLNLTAAGWAEPISWVFQIVILLANVLIVYSNLTAVSSVTAAFTKKGDPELARIDVKAFLDAADHGFPRWVMKQLTYARHTIVFGGSLLVLIALITA
ncbi:hypothetical protein [Nocardia sp. XZ_19_385]|uniref:hypothetical protein n=1 Tax=Nocardia sp. XZ_19_385 TaxID=2769488 RepID=UPI00188FE6F8|nr:hypothetical protein [Nocardia sp. XZ_19_385]